MLTTDHASRILDCPSGTRIVENVAHLFSTETGEDLPDNALAEMTGPTSDFLEKYMDRLTEMADHAAAITPSV